MVSIEQTIKEYYKELKEIDKNKKKLEMLLKQKIEIENDINNSNISLKHDLKGATYDTAIAKSMGVKVSPQERAIEDAFFFLEKQLHDTEIQIMELKAGLRNSEYKVCDIEYILSTLSEEKQNLIHLKYKNMYSTIKIGLQLNMSGSTVSRHLSKALDEVAEKLDTP